MFRDMTLRYFAYGSNLLIQRLTARCPSARLLGRATLEGHRVGFAKFSQVDLSGKATVLAAPGAAAEGVVYELSPEDLGVLDAIEGVGTGYDRHDAVTVRLDGRPLEVCTYVATAPEERHLPFDWYMALILAGALQHGLGPAATARLVAFGHRRDTELSRPARIAAVEALAAAGHADWERLLG